MPASPPDVSWHAVEPASALASLVSHDERGLTASEAQLRLTSYGPNVIAPSRGPGALRLLGRQLNSPIAWLLLGSGAVAIALGKVLDGGVVLGAVLINALVGFIQELRAGNAIAALSQMVPHEARVVRSGKTESVPSAHLVPGDVVLLASGDRVPADMRLLTSKNLQIEEAALTGESVPSQKATAPVPELAALADRRSMTFKGTLVTTGTARAVVVGTGQTTELGRISHLLREVTDLQTPLTLALAAVGTRLTLAVLGVSAVLLTVSLLRGYSLADAALVAITLAVATIPEGLPAIITITLAIGVQRMAARNTVIRKLPSVETLGSTSVICTDKTGTLTRNEMTVQAIDTPGGAYQVSGVGYSPVGAFSSSQGPLGTPPSDVLALLEAGVLCNDASLLPEGAAFKLSGDPTEGALLVSAMKAGVDVEALRRAWPRVDVVPFESETQFMATLHKAGGESVVFIKGAPEIVFDRCGLGVEARAAAVGRVASLAAKAMRVLAIGSRRMKGAPTQLKPADVEDGFTFLGLEGMMDPPRAEAIEAIQTCHAAGIVVKMITGDHLGTAEAIGRQLGILTAEGKGVTGADLSGFDAATLRKTAAVTHVFARVAPEHKLSLVKALQAEGHVVAMTGDGVNDAPALKQANVGIAMGITGTAVAREAADVVLADDNFASIASAVEEGRRIYDNLLKSLAFVLPANLGLGLILIAAVAFFPMLTIAGQLVPLMPVLPTQLLWVNLVTSVALSLPLAFEVKEPDAMKRPPRDPRAALLGSFVIVRTVLVALLMAAGAVGLFLWEYTKEASVFGHVAALKEAQTMAVTTVVFFQIFYLFSCRSIRGSIFLGFFSNWVVFAGIGGLLLLQAGFVYLPFMQAVFGTAALDPVSLGISALVASAVIPLIALEKAVLKRTHPPMPPPLRASG